MIDDDCDVTDFEQKIIPNTLQLKNTLLINTVSYVEADYISKEKLHVIKTIMFCRIDMNLIFFY